MTKKEMMVRLNDLIRQEAGQGSDTAVLFYFAQEVIEEHLGIDSTSFDYVKALEQKNNPLIPRTPCYNIHTPTYGRGHARGE